jgi:hypothetical protein
MIKFILILFLVGFLASRIIKWVLKYAFIGFVHQQQKQQYQNQNKQQTQSTTSDDIKKKNLGGEYVDYEVVK